MIEAGLAPSLRAACRTRRNSSSPDFPYDAPLMGALALGIAAARARLTREAPAWAD